MIHRCPPIYPSWPLLIYITGGNEDRGIAAYCDRFISGPFVGMEVGGLESKNCC